MTGINKYKCQRIHSFILELNDHFVHVLGVNQYSNSIYGKDINGKLMMINGDQMKEAVTPKGSETDIRGRGGFAAGKQYKRSDLLTNAEADVFSIGDVKYSSMCYIN